MAPSTLIVGVGNAFRSDDGAGPAAAKRLAAMLPADIRVIVKDGDVVSLLEEWRDAELVVLVDASCSGAAPGTIRRCDLREESLWAEGVRSSTHAFGVAQTVELARTMGRLPDRLLVFGIEGRDFSPGEGLSPEVDAAIEEVVRRVVEEASPKTPRSATVGRR
jgi:hydrogenase maturation protease